VKTYFFAVAVGLLGDFYTSKALERYPEQCLKSAEHLYTTIRAYDGSGSLDIEDAIGLHAGIKDRLTRFDKRLRKECNPTPKDKLENELTKPFKHLFKSVTDFVEVYDCLLDFNKMYNAYTKANEVVSELSDVYDHINEFVKRSELDVQKSLMKNLTDIIRTVAEMFEWFGTMLYIHISMDHNMVLNCRRLGEIAMGGSPDV
jgi:hypothetical protein